MENLYQNSRTFGYSVNKLIELVKVRPIIWDSTRTDFRSFNNKEKAWKEVYEKLDDKYLLADEKKQSEIGVKITAKWRNIRDAFIRSQKKRAQHNKVKKYMHHERLGFMLKLLGTDDTDSNPSRRISFNSQSTTENVTERSMSLDDCSLDDHIITVIKVEPELEDYTYSVTAVREPTDCNYSVGELSEYNDSVTPIIKVETKDGNPSSTDEENSNLKRKPVDCHDGNDETRSLKVRKLEMEPQHNTEDQPTERNNDEQALNSSESATDTVRELENIPTSPPDEDKSFFASILSFVRDMNEDEKLDFRMAVLRLIHETRLNRRLPASRQSRARD